MSILVVCPGCRKSFKVSEKFAGKSGPCPKCKKTLQVPTKAQEVQVHAPQQFAEGGRTTTGQLVTKPVAWTEAKIQPATMAIIAGASLATLILAFIGGKAGLFNNLVGSTLGLLVVSPPLVIGAYTVLRNDDLEPYRGQSLYIRVVICAAAYAMLWGVFAYLAHLGVITGDMWVWLFVVPPFLLMGGLLAFATLDLDFGDAMCHYGFYVVATLLLRWAAGMKWIWDISS